MNWNIVIFCVLSLVTLGRTEDIEISSTCREQFSRQTQLRDQCHNRLMTANEFYHEFNTTVLDFDGNVEGLPAVESFFTKYCGIIPQFLECFNLSNAVDAECRPQIPNWEFKSIIVQVLSSLIHYGCDNNAEMLKKLLPHNGFRFVFFNNDFDGCIAIAADFKTVNDLCLSIDRAQPCFEQTIGDHPNKDIIVIARDAMSRFKLAGNCEN